MRRDMDLVRAILQRVASADDGWDSEAFESYSEELVVYHVGIMIEAGLLSATDASSIHSASYMNCQLTWAGNDFLDSALEPKRWNEAKALIDKVGGASLQVWTDVLAKITMNALGL